MDFAEEKSGRFGGGYLCVLLWLQISIKILMKPTLIVFAIYCYVRKDFLIDEFDDVL